MDKQNLSLSELTIKIKEVIEDNFFENVWVVAEIGEIKYNRNGHAYLELIEKDKDNERILAKTKATIWSYTLRMLKPYFETTTGQELGTGLKILVGVKVEYHELYGFSLNILDIDPTYTLGDIERKRLEIISRLESEGVIGMNRELELPLVCQKIAIISSPTAAGYEDFVNQIQSNSQNYHFYFSLFPSVMQGDQAETSIIASLNQIYEHADFFDCVVIIRGGGSRSDLMCFDNYNLAYYITQFPLPVITGIGHDKDVSIVDMVSNSSLKTPTAVAEFLIERMETFDQRLEEAAGSLQNLVREFLYAENDKLQSLSHRFIPLVQKIIHHEANKLELAGQKLTMLVKGIIRSNELNIRQIQLDLKINLKNFYKLRKKDILSLMNRLFSVEKQQFIRHKLKLGYLENSISHFNPMNVLKKGYSITKKNGKTITDSSVVGNNDFIETVLFKGKINSRVVAKEKE
jgi:exodeoxyribonuclease VII large subunit